MEGLWTQEAYEHNLGRDWSTGKMLLDASKEHEEDLLKTYPC
jgi:hypothetical protein